MENYNVNPDTQNGENLGQDLNTLDQNALRELLIKERESITDLNEKNRQLFERAKKAEGFQKDDDGNWIKIIEKKPAKSEKKTTTDGSLDLGAKAYLKANGITEYDFVTKQMEDSGISDVEVLIENGYFKQALQTHRDVKAVEAATPKNGRSASGVDQKSTVEYWAQKGELPPNTPENRQLRVDVVNYKESLEKMKDQFA